MDISVIFSYFKIPKSLKLLKTPKSPKSRTYLYTALILVLLLTPILYFTLIYPHRAQAATLSLSTTATTVTITVTGRYTAVMTTNDTDDFLRFTDTAQGSNVTHEFAGPHINEGGVDYQLRWHNLRKTTILETTPARVRLRVEGCFDTSAGGTGSTCLTDGTNKLTVIEDYTFTPEGVYINNQTDFRTTGITLDADSAHQGYEWLGVYTDVTDAAFDDTANIIYGDGQTEATLAADGEFTNANSYVVLPGTGSDTYQDAVVGITRTGWLSANANGLTHEWNWDENETGTQDLITAQAQAGSSATARVYTASWFFLLKAEDSLDTEAEREALANDMRNPDLPTYTTGSQWTNGGAVAAGQVPAGASSGLSFDGVDDYVSAGDINTLDNPNEFTITAWVYHDTVAADHAIVDKAVGAAADGFLFFRDDVGSVSGRTDIYTAFIADSGDTDSARIESAQDAAIAGKWAHVAMTYVKNSSTGIRLYINGVEDANSPASTTSIGAINSGTTAVRFGRTTDNTRPYDGVIDDIRIYSTALNQNDIKSIMLGSSNIATASLVGHWMFNENTGSTTFDETTNNNDGTITGPTWTTGYVPDQYNEAEGAYTMSLASSNRGVFDLDAGANLSTLLNGAVTAGATSTTVDSSTGFPTTGVAWIDGDKHSYTGTTATTFTGIPSTGDLSIIGHADNTVVASMNRHLPFYKLRNWQSLGLPTSLTMEGKALTIGTDYNASLKPVTTSYWAQDVLFDSFLESSSAVTSPNVGTGTSVDCTFTAAKYGNGMLCDASGEEARVPMSNNVNAQTGTIEFWYKSTGTPATWSTFFNSSEGDNEFTLFRNSSNTSLMFNTNSGVDSIWSSIPNVFDLEWHHIRITYDTGTNSTYLYIDGVSQGEKAENHADVTISSYDLIIGTNSSDFTNPVNGIIDEFHIYNTVIGPDLIAKGGDTADSDEYLADEANDQTLSFADDDASNRGEYLFLGSDSQFQGLNVDLATNGVGSSADFDWEYWNGTGWSALSVTDVNTGASKFTADGNFYWDAPGNWFPYSVNGSTDLYYIRGHLEGGSYTTSPIEDAIKTDILLVNYLSNLTAQDQTLAFPSETGSAADSNKGGPPLTHWSMDEATDNTCSGGANDVCDRIGDNDLSKSGATWTVTGAGMQPNEIYLQFDGSNDYLNRTYDGEFDFATDSFTAAGWFRHSSTIAGTDTLVARATAVNGIGWKVYMNSSGYLCFGIDDTAGSFPEDDACTGANLGTLADSRWHHFEAVKNGTTNLTMYINGNQIDQQGSLGSVATLSGDAALYIGIDADGASNPWDGFLDNIFVYHYARSADQVKADFNGGPGRGVSF